MASVRTGSTDAPDADRRARHGSYRSGFAFGVLSSLAVAILSVVSTIATARIYGVRIVGQFALVSAPVAALWVLSTAKEQAALIKQITLLPPRHPRVTQLFAAVFTFSSGLTLAIALVDALVCWFVFRGPLHHPDLVVPTFVNLAGYVLVTNTGWNIDSIFSAFVAGRQLFWVRLHETLSFIAIAVAIGLAWRSTWGLVIALIGASLTSLVHRAIAVLPFVRPRLSMAEYRLGLRELPGLLRFGLKITPGSVAQGVSQQAGIWAIAAIAPVAAVGAYSRAQAIPQKLQQVNMRIVEVLYPTLVGRRERGDGAGFDRALIDSIRYGMVGMLLVGAVGGGAARAILNVFGPGFSRATPALALLLLYPACYSIAATQTQALWAVGRPGLTSFIQLARLAMTIVATVALTPAMGIAGPAVALLAGFAVAIALNTLALLPFMSRPVRQTWPWRERLALVWAYAGGFAAAHAAEQLTSTKGAVVLAMFCGPLAFAVLFLTAGGANARDRARAGELIGRLRARRAPLAAEPALAAEPSQSRASYS